MPTPLVNFRCPDDLRLRIDRAARRSGVDRSAYVLAALTAAVEHGEQGLSPLERISGEWLYDSESNTYDAAYWGEVVGSWPSGVQWLATAEVARAVAVDQAKVAEGMGRDATLLSWDGDTLVVQHPDGEPDRVEPEPDGRYLIAWWTWAVLDDDDVVGVEHG